MIEITNCPDKTQWREFVYDHPQSNIIQTPEMVEIEEAIANGEIIEAYPDDPRGPSCLILGFTHQSRPLHIVCGDLDAERILVVTAYEPSSGEWEEDWKTRR